MSCLLLFCSVVLMVTATTRPRLNMETMEEIITAFLVDWGGREMADITIGLNDYPKECK